MEDNSAMDKKIVFFGTTELAAIVLERLAVSSYKPILVVTTPDMPVGRKQIITPSPVKLIAEKNNIDVAQPVKLSEIKDQLILSNPDFFIVAAYGKIIPQSILDIPSQKSINVHPSLLPRWRGASPIKSAILAGDKETGVTIMLMDAQMDHGPVLSQIKCPITNNTTGETLLLELANISSELLLKTIPSWLAGEITPQEQNHEQAIFCTTISKEDGHIDWNKSAEEIERMIRAYTPWPGTFTLWNGKRIIIHSARVANLQQENLEVGKVIVFENAFAIQTGLNILIPIRVQYEGKKEQSAQEFFRGHSQIIGAILM